MTVDELLSKIKTPEDFKKMIGRSPEQLKTLSNGELAMYMIKLEDFGKFFEMMRSQVMELIDEGYAEQERRIG